MSERRSNKVSKLTSEKSEYGGFEEERQVYKSNRATVEVTVKVKKRRHHDLDGHQHGTAFPDKPFPKGSWGDLLSQNRLEDRKDCTGKTQGRVKCVSEDGDNPKTICHRIPISNDLYLETHTHVKSRSPSAPNNPVSIKAKSSSDRMKKDQRFLAENDFLRDKIEKLRVELEKVKLQNKKKRESYRTIKKKSVVSAPPPPSSKFSRESTKQIQKGVISGSASGSKESKHTSTTSMGPLVLVEKRSGVTQTDGRSPPKSVATSGEKDYLKTENEALRSEAAQLLAEMEKARQEQAESITTIRELYQLAEMLKRENQELQVAQEEQVFLQEKLVQALEENQGLKGYLDEMVTKQKNTTSSQNYELDKFRKVIEEVKSTIEEEMQGIALKDSQASLYGKPESARGFDFNISEGASALLNDTDASEIQRILGSGDEAHLNQNSANYSPTAIMKDYLKQFPSASTPAESSISGSERSSPKERSYLGEIDGTKGDPIENARQSIGRSFKPIQMELRSGSTSSEYRSTTSTPTNINP